LTTLENVWHHRGIMDTCTATAIPFRKRIAEGYWGFDLSPELRPQDMAEVEKLVEESMKLFRELASREKQGQEHEPRSR